MIIDHILSGLTLGLFIAMPFGPTSLYCVQQTLYSGRISTCFHIGLGAAIAHVFYAYMALMGLKSVQNYLYSHQHWLQILGGVILCLMAYNNYHKKPSQQSVISASSPIGYSLTTLILTLSNPMTIAHFVALMTTQQPAIFAFTDVIAYLFGLMAGSIGWRLTLGSLSYILAKKLQLNTLLDYFHQAGVWMIAAYGIRTLWPILAGSQLTLAIIAGTG